MLAILLFSLSAHEFAHAWSATKLWDPTPKMQGRLTLNPIAHIDPIGLVMLFLVHIWWAKPVIINPRYFKNPIRDELIVALAWPFTNLAIAFLMMLAQQVIAQLNIHISYEYYQFMSLVAIYNVYLAIFNLLPLPPLDWYRIIQFLYPPIQKFIIQYYYHISIFIFASFVLFQRQLFGILDKISNEVLKFMYYTIQLIFTAFKI